MSESGSQIREIKRAFAGLQTLYHTAFPKSDPYLIHDLLRRLARNPEITPIYMVEVFTKKGVNPEAAMSYIFEKTGMVTAIYENGTLFVTNQKLTLEMLKEISDLKDVLEIARGPSHTHTDTCPLPNLDYS